PARVVTAAMRVKIWFMHAPGLALRSMTDAAGACKEGKEGGTGGSAPVAITAESAEPVSVSQRTARATHMEQARGIPELRSRSAWTPDRGAPMPPLRPRVVSMPALALGGGTGADPPEVELLVTLSPSSGAVHQRSTGRRSPIATHRRRAVTRGSRAAARPSCPR